MILSLKRFYGIGIVPLQDILDNIYKLLSHATGNGYQYSHIRQMFKGGVASVLEGTKCG